MRLLQTGAKFAKYREVDCGWGHRTTGVTVDDKPP
jgi:hypothetical protein